MPLLAEPEPPQKAEKTYRCGTLLYTRRGLVALFAWMLWGDFCFTLMEAVVPSILPVKLRGLDAPNTLIGFIMTTLPGVFNVSVTPWLSFRSDRFRSRWGRRLPFILCTMPFLTLSLVCIGYSDRIGQWVHSAFLEGSGISQAKVIIILLAVFAAAFDLFNMFVNTVYWYLFNDVVPAQHLGKFMAYFRIVGIATAALYQFFIFKYASTHMQEIFLGAALLYLFGFGLTCLRVKEGDYPPPDVAGESEGLVGKIKTYIRECFSSRFYWDIFLTYTFHAASGTIGVYYIFFQYSLGLNNDLIGKMAGVSAVTIPLCLLFAGSLVDRWHPVRASAYCMGYQAFTVLSAWVWLLVDRPSVNAFFWITLTQGAVFNAMFHAVWQTGEATRLMRLFPQGQYGQLSGALALVRAAAIMVGGVLAGAYLDWWAGVFGKDYANRFQFTWSGPFLILSFYFHYRTFRAWKRQEQEGNIPAPAMTTPPKRQAGKVNSRLLIVPGVAFLGLMFNNMAWIVYYVWIEPQAYYLKVFIVAAGINLVLGLAYLRFVKFMERP